MRAARWLGVCALGLSLFGLSLSLTAAARPARSRGLDDPVGLTTRAADIPVLAALLAQAQWEPTPELSGVFRAGSIYEVTATGHRPLATGCFAATPTISTYTSTELVTSLQAGVPGGKARRALEAVSRAWQRCVAPSGGLSPGSAAPAPGGLSP